MKKGDELEEVAANLADPNLCKTDNWIAGARWQAQRLYNEDEVFEIVAQILHTPSLRDGSWNEISEWFNQHKKKRG